MNKKAFTLIELIAVIVIMGILATIGINIILSMYKNYLHSRSINFLEARTETALEQISKRLQYRIKESVIGRNSFNYNDYFYIEDTSIGLRHNMLEWIGSSSESLRGLGGANHPGWSGFIDLDNSNKTVGLSTPRSALVNTRTIVSSLTNKNDNIAIIFKNMTDDSNMSKFGWHSNTNAIYPIRVNLTVNNNFTVNPNDVNNFSEITEQYNLVHTAYAIVPSSPNTNCAALPNGFRGDFFDLCLSYNYAPWNGKKYNDNTTKKALLAQNVSMFRTTQRQGVMIVKLCIADNNTSIGRNDADFRVCKEKVIF